MKTYKNPFQFENQWSEYEFGDPFIMRFNGMYYLYCTSQGDYIKCWTSEDLVDFKYAGSVCDDPKIYRAFAPEVTYYKGRFYMIASPMGNGHYLLEATEPTGPFRIISDNYGLLIDGSFFIDDDGKQYMSRASHKGIIMHDMPSPDKIDVNGTIIQEAFLNHWTEGSMVIKRDGLYYLTYTGNHFLSKGYRIAYSVSDKAPDKGYVNLKNQILLLETGSECHAIGHSSSFLAPDLDSYCIAYHSIDLDTEPRKRSANIDRLYFNGARMYCNPMWWYQPAHKMPEFHSRGIDKLQEIIINEKKYWVTPVNTPQVYTAEWNVNSNGSSVCLIYGLKDGHYGSIKIMNDGTYLVKEESKLKTSGQLNEAISFDGMITIRFACKSDHSIDIYINNMYLCGYRTDLGDGVFGIQQNCGQDTGYVAFSACAEGNGDKVAYKAIPGRFDVIHCEEAIENVAFKDAGHTVYGGHLIKGKQYTYSVNVKKAGEYKLIARLKKTADEYTIKVILHNEERSLKCHLNGICDEAGYEVTMVGNVLLEQGAQKLILEAESDKLIIDYLEFIEASPCTPLEVIKEGNLVTDCMQILGPKMKQSMNHKYSGFTCAEGQGMGFVGEEGMTDYRVAAIVNRNCCNTGDLSIYVRATKESWYGPQVKEALFGYRIQITIEGIYLYRETYEEKLLAFYSLTRTGDEKLNLTIEAVQSKITISVDNRTVITYIDPDPYLYGKIGIGATGLGFGIDYLSIY